MKYLLDTHTFIWFVAMSTRLSEPVREVLANPAHEKYLSLVTVWEMQIKAQLGKLTLHRPLRDLVNEQLAQNPLQLLVPTLEHVWRLNELAPHHRDPFDRLLIAQAIAEDMIILTRDTQVGLYDVRVLW